MFYKFHIKCTHLNVVTAIILVVSPEESHIVARSKNDSVNFYLYLCHPKITKHDGCLYYRQLMCLTISVAMWVCTYYFEEAISRWVHFMPRKNKTRIAEDSQHFKCCLPTCKAYQLATMNIYNYVHFCTCYVLYTLTYSVSVLSVGQLSIFTSWMRSAGWRTHLQRKLNTIQCGYFPLYNYVLQYWVCTAVQGIRCNKPFELSLVLY
jgi:hypothetical protein